MNQENPYDAEFLNYNEFINISYSELRSKIEKLRLDTIQANDLEVKAFAEKKYLEYRRMYLEVFDDDLQMQKLYEVGRDDEVDEDV